MFVSYLSKTFNAGMCKSTLGKTEKHVYTTVHNVNNTVSSGSTLVKFDWLKLGEVGFGFFLFLDKNVIEACLNTGRKYEQ